MANKFIQLTDPSTGDNVYPVNFSEAQDYIIEQGDSGVWHFIKYNSGLAYCIGKQEYESGSVNITTAWGSLFYGRTPSISFPFSFISEPIVNSSITITGSYSVLMGDHVQLSEAESKIKYPQIEVIRATSSSQASFIVNMIAFGRWK